MEIWIVAVLEVLSSELRDFAVDGVCCNYHTGMPNISRGLEPLMTVIGFGCEQFFSSSFMLKVLDAD